MKGNGVWSERQLSLVFWGRMSSSISSSAVQSRLNSQSISAINPDYYIDQNRGKQNLFDVFYITLNGGGTFVLQPSMIHNGMFLVATCNVLTTLKLPSPELCLGVEFSILCSSTTGARLRISTTANAGSSVSVVNNMRYIISANNPEALVNGTQPGAGVTITFQATGVNLLIRSLGHCWFVSGMFPDGAGAVYH